MLPLHLPMRITTGAQVRTATMVMTKPFENVTVKYIKLSNSFVILFDVIWYFKCVQALQK